MGVLIDVLGAVIIGGLLLMMLITFQYQITETAERQMYAATMASHLEQASTRLNKLIGLAGLGIEDPKDAVVVADTNQVIFRTYWDCVNDVMGATSGDPYFVRIKLEDDANGAMGKAVVLRQSDDLANIDSGTVLENMGYIFWVDRLRFVYYDIDGNETTEAVQVRAAELMLTFRREAPRMGSRDLTNRLQLKCFLSNTYLQMGT